MSYDAFVCPHHGLLSEREMEDAWEIGPRDRDGEPTEPFGCPIFGRRVPIPTTMGRDEWIGEGWFTLGDPGWSSFECLAPLRQIRLEEAT